MIDAATRRLLARYKRETLPACSVLDAQDLDSLLPSIEVDQGATGVSTASPDFPSHGGTKEALPYQLEVI